MKVKRTYGQYCGLARALDRVGERWTLLIVRELLLGPRRYSDLQRNLPGIGTNLLAERLKALEADGVVVRRVLPPPAASAVYELTERGRALRDAVVALARWGFEDFGAPAEDDAFSPEWLTLTMEANFRAERAAGIDETYEYRIDQSVFHVRVRDGEMEARHGSAAAPDLVVTAPAEGFLALGSGAVKPREAVRRGLVQIDGPLRTLERSVRLLAPGGA